MDVRAVPEKSDFQGHTPVLYETVLAHLALGPDSRVIDGTLGGAGHASGLLQATAPTGRLLGLDRDPAAIARARERLAPFGQRAVLVQSSFAELDAVARTHDFAPADGVLLDLGLSSYQLAAPERGFSFVKDGPLDMRFDPAQGLTAADLVNQSSVEELANILYRYGEERQSRRIARAIAEARPIERTGQLAEVIARAKTRGSRRRTVRPGSRRSVRPGSRRVHPATQSFQALRIAVNDELGALEAVLPQAEGLLRPGGRLAVISFHSLEDRLVKRFFRRQAKSCICPPQQPVCNCQHEATLRVITRKPLRADEDEVARNPRARSARLRVAERL
jgi:16S rRNA (cytosine1402-N4)-methyltransferase